MPNKGNQSLKAQVETRHMSCDDTVLAHGMSCDNTFLDPEGTITIYTSRMLHLAKQKESLFLMATFRLAPLASALAALVLLRVLTASFCNYYY